MTNNLLKHPALVGGLCGVLGALITAYLAAKPSFRQQTLDMNDTVLDARVEVVELQAELRAIREQANTDVQPLFQAMTDLFDHYDVGAWVKVKDYKTGRWHFIAINNTYSERYGVSFQALNKTVEELYESRELSPEGELAILRYEVNDERAALLRPGRDCLVFNEWAAPLDDAEGYYNFVKCPLVYNSSVYVFGHRAVVD